MHRTSFALIKEPTLKYVDLRFTDRVQASARMQHVSTINDDVFENGLQFDGSSIGGLEGDQRIRHDTYPDPTTAVMDPSPPNRH